MCVLNEEAMKVNNTSKIVTREMRILPRDPRSVKIGSHAKQRNSTHIASCTDRKCYVQRLVCVPHMSKEDM